MALLLALCIFPILGFVLSAGGFLSKVASNLAAVFSVLGLAFALLGVETIAWWQVGRSTKAGRPLSRWPGFVLVGVESMAPTLGLVLLGTFLPGAHALTAPQLLVYAVFIIPSAVRLDPWLCVVSGLLSALSYATLASVLLVTGRVDHPLEEEPATHFMRAVYLLLTGGAAAFVATQLRKRFESALHAGLERARVVDIFGRYLHDDIVARLLHDPDGLRLGGERREITVMMTDLRGFSAIAESLPPEQVVTMLNRYLAEMVPVVMDAGGTIDEIIGDALLVLWNAPSRQPDHELRAVTCAVSMQQRMDAVNSWTVSQGLPRWEMGIGIHTGDAVVGNIGGDRRQKYGVVGTTVNLAARVESITVGGQVLITKRTLSAADESVIVGESRNFRPKGSSEPMEVVEVLGVGNQRLGGFEPPLLAVSPRELTLRLVHGKSLDPRPISAVVQAVSNRCLRVAASFPAGDLEDVQVEYGGASAYARVTPEPQGTFLLRITSLAGAAALGEVGLLTVG